MEITRHQEGEVLELRVAGRLDAYWADHLRDELQEAIRGGAHQIQLDFSGVTFLSSAGLRVLLTGYQQLSAIQGSLAVIRPSPGVQQVLELAGFDELLVAEAAPPPVPGAQLPVPDPTPGGAPDTRGPAPGAGRSAAESARGPAPAAETAVDHRGLESAAPPPPPPGVGTLDEARPPATVEPGPQPSPLAPSTAPQALERETARFEVFPLAPGATLRCRLVGEPERLTGGGFGREQCHLSAFPDETFGVGVGAPGSSFEECRDRFGEFLAVAGSAAYLPTDGTNVPDYLMAAGTFVPELQVLYGLQCEGTFALLTRFEAKEEAGGVTLSQLAGACLELAGSPAAGIVIVAQSAGLVGAALRRSPGTLFHPLAPADVSAAGGGAGVRRRTRPADYPDGAAREPFSFPEIRQWLSFTPERAHTRSLALVAGVAARGAAGRLEPVLRPLANDGDWQRTVRLAGHFHAAAFSYRPLQRGALDLKTTVGTLFEAETLQGVLHLLHDDRPIVGAGESEFVRGACWVSPINEL